MIVWSMCVIAPNRWSIVYRMCVIGCLEHVCLIGVIGAYVCDRLEHVCVIVWSMCVCV